MPDLQGDNMKKNTLRLVARIISIPVLLFTLFMLLSHLIFPHSEYDTEPIAAVEYVMLIVMLISIGGLALAWHYELLGGAVCVSFFVIHLFVYWRIRGTFFPLSVLVNFTPVLVDGLLFLVDGIRRNNKK